MSAKRCHKGGKDPLGKFLQISKQMKDLEKKVPCVGILLHSLKYCTINFKQEAVSIV